MTMATTFSTTLAHRKTRLRDLPYDRQVFLDELTAAMEDMPFHLYARQQITRTFDPLCHALETCLGLTLQERRKSLHGVYRAVHGEDSFRNPTAEEWAAFAASCSLRDMGTHVCALPTGEYCPKGLVCLGCVHAQPKKSAAPIFRRMLASHERALAAASKRGEPAGQLAARELEVVRIRGALTR